MGMKCQVCGIEIKSDRWAKVRAANLGWSFLKDGTAYCPSCVPSWVKEWRARKKRYGR